MAESSASYRVFVHLNADNGTLYRAILGVFVVERARFVISLRPAEVLAALSAGAGGDSQISNSRSAIDAEGVSAALQQLRLWGNLDDTADNADAASIEEFTATAASSN